MSLLHKTFATKAHQFDTKVAGLQDVYRRLVSEKNNAVEVSKEVALHLKYFHITFTSWLKESRPMFIDNHFDESTFPTARYDDLFDTLLDLITQTQSLDDEDLDDALLKTVAYIVPFLPRRMQILSPLSLANCLFEVTGWMQTQIIDLLTQYLFPLVLQFLSSRHEDNNSNNNSEEIVATVLATVLDATSNTGSWTKIMECGMRYKHHVVQDLLVNLAYGTADSLEPSIHLINRYFAPVNISVNQTTQSSNYDTIVSHMCQSPQCQGGVTSAAKVILDPQLCVALNNAPPPLFLCRKCFKRMVTDADTPPQTPLYLDVVQPATQVSQICDNSNCRFGFMKAVYFCFSPECAAKNEMKPMRLCEDCHHRLHTNPADNHANHRCLQELWSTPQPQRGYMLDGIVRLCSQAQPDFKEKYKQIKLEIENLFTSTKSSEDYDYMAKMAQSFHGVYLLTKICTLPPSSTHQVEDMGRLLSMAFVWVESVEYTHNAQMKKLIRQYRQDVLNWIRQVLDLDFELYISCLLPDPPMFARVGHPWNMLTSRVRKNLEILQRLVALNNQALLPRQVWGRVMPIWLQEIKEQVPESEMKSFREILRCLFGIESKTDYSFTFINNRLQSTASHSQSIEALVWVQILSYLDIRIEMKSLLEDFIHLVVNNETSYRQSTPSVSTVFPFPDRETLQRMDSHRRSNTSSSTTSPTTVLPVIFDVTDRQSVAVLVLDVLIKQLVLQKKTTSEPNEASVSSDDTADHEHNQIKLLLVCLLRQSLETRHSLESMEFQIVNVVFYQTSLLLDLTVVKPIVPPSGETNKQSIVFRKCTGVTDIQGEIIEEEDENEKPAEEMEKTVEELEKEVDEAAELANDNSEEINHVETTNETNTSEDATTAKLKSTASFANDLFDASCLSTVPEIRIVDSLLNQLERIDENNVVLHILSCLEILFFRGKCLHLVAQKDPKLLHEFQETKLIPSLWKLLDPSTSNTAHQVVPLLMHCTRLPHGAHTLCLLVEHAFADPRLDWKTRLDAVGKVGLLCQFFTATGNDAEDLELPTSSPVVVHCLAFLTAALQDVNNLVALQAKTMLQNVKLPSLKHIYKIVEQHYTDVEEDRLPILGIYRALYRTLPATTSPVDAAFFLNMLKMLRAEVVKSEASLVFKEFSHTLQERASILPLYSRKILTEEGEGEDKTTSVQVPLFLYKNKNTLVKRCPSKPFLIPAGAELKEKAQKQAQLGTVIEDTVLKRFISHQKPVGEALAPQEDEICSILVHMLVQYLSDNKNNNNEETIAGSEEPVLGEIARHLGWMLGLRESSGEATGWRLPADINMDNMRKSPVFTSLLLNLPQLLDRHHSTNSNNKPNFTHLSVMLLKSCVRAHSHEDVFAEKTTLTRLDTRLQYAWLTAFVVILYKHTYQDYTKEVWELVSVARNTIDAHPPHHCQQDAGGGKLSLASVVRLKMKTKMLNSKHQDAYYSEQDFELSTLERSRHEDGSTHTTLDRNGTRHRQQTDTPTTTEDHLKKASLRKCGRCDLQIVSFDEETITLSIVALLTFVHCDATLAAPFIVEIIDTVTKKVGGLTSTSSVAQKFLRCVFYKLAPNRLFPELFRVHSQGDELFSKMASVLCDYGELNQLQPLHLSMEEFVENHSSDRIAIFLQNIYTYTKCISSSHATLWKANVFKDFFKLLPSLLPAGENMDCILDMMSLLLHTQKVLVLSLIEQLDDVMTHIVKHCTFTVDSLHHICASYVDLFSREKSQGKVVREQWRLSRKLCMILATVVTNKSYISEPNLARLVQVFCRDMDMKFDFPHYKHPTTKTPVKDGKLMECLDHYHLHDVFEYMKAPVRQLKDSFGGRTLVDSFESYLKLAISQLVVVYASYHNTSKMRMRLAAIFVDPGDRIVGTSNLSIDVSDHANQMRLLAWMYLACTNYRQANHQPCVLHFVALRKSVLVARLIVSLLRSVLESDGNFAKGTTHLRVAFLLAQIWTVYTEQNTTQQQTSSLDSDPMSLVREFWSLLTPRLYPLLQHSSQIQIETINLFSTMVESFSVVCPRTYSQLYPLWVPLLQLYINEIPANVLHRINSYKGPSVERKPGELLIPWILDMHRQLWRSERKRFSPAELIA